MFRWWNLLLLCLIHYIESTPRSVTGEQGGCVTLSCEFEDRNISNVALSRYSKIIPIYPNEKEGRIFKKGSCDVVIKDLRFSDSGTYILSVYCKNGQTEVKPKTLEYQLDIHEKPHTDEERSVESRIIVLSVSGALLVLVISALIWKYQRQNRNTEHESVPMQNTEQESRTSRDDTDFS